VVPVLAGRPAEITLYLEEGIDPSVKFGSVTDKYFGPAGINSASSMLVEGTSRIAPGCYRVGAGLEGEMIFFFP
jgi:hypothetical protein